jgi:hypothetical protein|mmetsp:Transcript_73586/g.123990  ORF Transcript_73586/g.123990 Transcript_73586/m.123990 type:complete len:98 (-) Transcript_73586:508-801(-)
MLRVHLHASGLGKEAKIAQSNGYPVLFFDRCIIQRWQLLLLLSALSNPEDRDRGGGTKTVALQWCGTDILHLHATHTAYAVHTISAYHNCTSIDVQK